MESAADFHKGAAKAHLILAKAYWDSRDEEMARHHTTRAREELLKAKTIEEQAHE